MPAAPGSRLPVFRSVFADIGDEQSIAANLSTFSWHITNIASMDRALALPALVLLDEIGSGHRPGRGRRARDGGRRALPDAGRARALHDARRGDEDLRVDHAGRGRGGVRLRPRDLRAQLPPGLRVAGPQPGARNRGAPRAQRRRHRPGAARTSARATRSWRSTWRRIDENLHELEHERRLVARERQVLGDAETRIKSREEALRQREEAFRRKVGGAARRSPARRAARDRQGRRRPEAAGVGVDRGGRAAPVEAGRPGCRASRPGTRGPRGARRGRRSKRPPPGSAGEERASGRPAPAAAADARPAVAGDRVVVAGLGHGGHPGRDCTATRRRSTCTASGCARASATCGSSPRPGGRRRQKPRRRRASA